jgi:hypothetical protein
MVREALSLNDSNACILNVKNESTSMLMHLMYGLRDFLLEAAPSINATL